MNGGGPIDGSGGPIATPPITPVDLSVLGPSTLGPTSTPSTNAAAASGAPWWGQPLFNAITAGLKTGSTIASYQLNPLYQKGTYVQTPQGGIMATNAPTAGAIPGLTTGMGSMMPLLLLGGAVLVFMMMSRRG
jgi:hypothetical protein